jgi:hypothetical protein
MRGSVDREQAESPNPVSEAGAEPISFAEFLESVPPSQTVRVGDLYTVEVRGGGFPPYSYRVNTPAGTLLRKRHLQRRSDFSLQGWRPRPKPRPGVDVLLHLPVCSNCRQKTKIYSLFFTREEEDAGVGTCYKFGEAPIFGPPTPTRLLRMIGTDRETFLKGRRCENQDLGIGAFTYYRRVVENQKVRIFDEIIKVAQKTDASPDMIADLHQAGREIQFTKATDSVKPAIPESLWINGHNPITLLHSALSHGVHELTDEMCLELAHDARVVLAELSDRVGQLLKDEAELSEAVSRLSNARQEK